MGLPNEIHPFHLAGAGQGYQVSNSLRFRNSVSANLSKAAYGGYPMTATWSCWIKRGSGLGSTRMSLLASNDRGDYFDLFTFQADTLEFWHRYNNGDSFFYTNAVFRDPSAWYHIVLIMDPSQASNSNRVKIYVNGVSQTLTVSGTWTQNQNFRFFSPASSTTIGGVNAAPTMTYFDGYMAEMYFIEGAYDPSYFGQTDSITGQWVPKKYTGTYGTNGFYLPFNDATSTTTLGYDRQLGPTDSSKNNWTLNNFAVFSPANTVSTTHDSYIDSPTAYDDGSTYYNRGNYATWNPLNAVQSTLSQGNLRSEATGSSTDVITTFPTSTTGKWYAEISINATPNINWPIRIGAADRIGAVGSASSTYCLLYTDWSGFYIYKSLNGSTSTVAPSGSLPADGDILKIAYDADAGKLWLGLNSGWYGTTGSITGDPATGTDATLSGATNKNIYPNHNNAGGPARVMFLNCGQRPFRYTPPTGFLALNTYNLANPSLPLV